MPLMKLPRTGDRVNVKGREGVFFVLKCDIDLRTVSLLPSDDGEHLDDISVDTLTILPGPDANGARNGSSVKP
jgi:hypothetical protein